MDTLPKTGNNRLPSRKLTDDFFFRFPRQKDKKGKVLFRNGDASHRIYYVVSGWVKQYAISINGNPIIFHLHGPGSFFPLTAMMGGAPCRYFYEAVTDVTYYQAPVADVKAFLTGNAPVLFDLSSRLFLGINGLLYRIELLTYSHVQHRILSLLLYFSRHFGVKRGKSVTIKQIVTHNEIASWVGSTRETVTVEMEQLKKSGLIRCRGHSIIIRNMAKIEQILSQVLVPFLLLLFWISPNLFDLLALFYCPMQLGV